MALKFFTGKLYNNSVAINSDLVYSVTENKDGGSRIHVATGQSIEVTDDYLETVARLNEKD